ncbi:MAG: hypothetical protein A2Y38_18195 [Spirochaetes bacterium GWB1_59_5]|nr:MAG: hypothetical protein A2Y38_18195 [Spirochaetes bacterium GWB1_59_5]
MSHLYDLTAAYCQIAVLAEESEDGAWEQALADLSDSIELKAENIVKLIRSLEADAEAYSAEANRMREQYRTRHNRVDSLKDYLQANLEVLGLTKVKAGLFRVGLHTNPPSCRIVNQEAVPSDYQRVIPEQRVVDARAVIDAWKRGELVPGTEVSQGKSLRIW